MYNILIVDDEVNILKLMEIWLKRAGFGVVTAVNGEDAQRNVTIMSDALALRGYSHMLIKPSGALGASYASSGMVKVTSSDTLPSSGNTEGDVIHLTADVEATSTNDALSAGMLAQWNGTKWVKYDGDIYV